MKSFQQIPTIQVAIVTATLITCLSHIGDLLLWTALVASALAMLRYGAKTQDSSSDNDYPIYFPDEEQDFNNSEPEVQLADLTELQENLWQDEAIDEQELGTTPVQADVDADIVEPMPNLREKAAANWGYRGSNVKPPTPANDTEVSLIAARLRLVLPKETSRNRKTWSALCKQLSITGYTPLKDAKPSAKALWLSQRASFEDVVKASIKLAA